MSSPFSTGNMGVAPTQEGVPLRHVGGFAGELCWRGFGVPVRGVRFHVAGRGVRDCFGAVDGIVSAAHNASMCALMYLFAAFFDAFGAFAAWFAAFFYMGNL